MVKSYSQDSATATVATVATHSGLTVARVATVAVATRSDEKERLTKRWQWFLKLAMKHGINPVVVGAEFPTEQDRLDVIEPAEHTDELLRECMATLCRDARVRRRQRNYKAGTWAPVNPDGEVIL